MTFLFQVEIKMKDIRKNEMALEKLRGRNKREECPLIFGYIELEHCNVGMQIGLSCWM